MTQTFVPVSYLVFHEQPYDTDCLLNRILQCSGTRDFTIFLTTFTIVTRNWIGFGLYLQKGFTKNYFVNFKFNTFK